MTLISVPLRFSGGDMTAEKMFQGIADGLLRERSITQAKMFGAQGLRSGGKVFAFLWKQRLVVKLPQDRVEQLVREESAVRFDPGHGRVSKEWVSVAADAKTNWTPPPPQGGGGGGGGRRRGGR